ncbi:MAG: mechanosensitive ion channel protein MscS [Flavobacteriales bacterium]|nr:mechanosensitive ion channel protein MscS [Flavobacteriales bacterium]|tara:strand:+ start:7996 stop:9288 length:1293 start_codon:yes stop_codon:yes gene_type:complete
MKFTKINTNNVIQSWGNSYSSIIDNFLNSLGVEGNTLFLFKMIIISISLVLFCLLADLIARKTILVIIERIIKKTKNTWDDVLIEKKVFKHVAHIVPALLIGVLAPVLYEGHPDWILALEKISEIYLTIAFIITIVAFFKAFQFYLESRPFLKGKPLDSYMQLIRLIVYILGGIYIISILVDKSPMGIFSALGAMSVVLMLVFKDTILGFVGSIQIAANDMVKIGDWVEFPKFGADGDVIEIKLQTVKVQNWDKTITTIPTYSFVSDAFKNWRGMSESGGRRIKRSISLDMNSVKFCDENLLNNLKNIDLLKDYFSKKTEEIESFNSGKDINHSANIRQLTNLGSFRAYLEKYLSINKKISKEMTFLVRQLAPNEKGLPIEIYVFSSEQRWAHYEAIQSDIFDHIIAILPEFELNVFQNPSGNDFKKLGV